MEISVWFSSSGIVWWNCIRREFVYFCKCTVYIYGTNLKPTSSKVEQGRMTDNTIQVSVL